MPCKVNEKLQAKLKKQTELACDGECCSLAKLPLMIAHTREFWLSGYPNVKLFPSSGQPAYMTCVAARQRLTATQCAKQRANLTI